MFNRINVKLLIISLTSFLAISIFVSIYLIDRHIISTVIEKNRSDTLELLSTKTKDKLESTVNNIELLSNIISKNISKLLYDIEESMITIALIPFMEIKEIEAIEVFDLSTNQTLIFVWRENGVSYSNKIPLNVNISNLSHIVNKIVYENNFIGELRVFYRLDSITFELENIKDKYMHMIDDFEQKAKGTSFYYNLVEIVFVTIILFLLNFFAIRVITILNHKNEEYQKNLKNKNIELNIKNRELKEGTFEIQERELKLHTILENANEGIILLDENGYIEYINPFFEELVGYKLSNIKGLSFDNLFLNEAFVYKFLYTLDSIKEQNSKTFLQFSINKRDKSEIFVESSFAYIVEQDKTILMLKDRTEDIKRVLELEKLATIDNLTKISNRHKCNSVFDSIIKNKELFSVIMIDIDYFKKINDNYGHDMGDEVLKKVAKVINSTVKHNICFARWGGEEFLILLRADIDLAYAIAEEIRLSVARAKVDPVESVTISLGVCEYKNGTKKDILKQVDKALYIAKDGGRNRTIRI